MFFTILILFTTGCAGGLLAGLLGIGGGVIYVLVLTVFLEKIVPGSHDLVRYVIANSAFAVFFAGLSGSIRQYKMGNFYAKEVLTLAIPSVSTALVLSLLISSKDWYSKKIFLIIITVVISLLIIKSFWDKNKNSVNTAEVTKPTGYIFTGFTTGLFGAFTGLGGGIISVPLLHSLLRVKIKKATSISLGVMPFFTLAMTILYAFRQPAQHDFNISLGYILPAYVAPLILGVIIFSPLGVRLSTKISDLNTRVIFTVVVILALIRLFSTTF